MTPQERALLVTLARVLRRDPHTRGQDAHDIDEALRALEAADRYRDAAAEQMRLSAGIARFMQEPQ